MAIAVISSENKTANGTITVPVGCTAIYAVVKGSVTPPSIAGVAMQGVTSIAVNGIMPAAGVFQALLPTIGARAFTFTGTLVQFIYLSGSGDFRPGVVIGQSTTGSLTGDLNTGTTDLVIAAIFGSIGPTSLKGDTVAMTYLLNTTLDKIGYIVPGDALLTCLAEDTGISAGYTVDGGVLHHDAVLVTAGYTSYDPVWHEGYYTTETQTTPGYYQFHRVWVAAHTIQVWSSAYNKWITQTVPGYWDEYYSWVDPVTTQVQVWQDGYNTYPPVWHDPVYTPAYDEELPDTWVPGGNAASITAIFVSIKITPGGDFVPSVIFFG